MTPQPELFTAHVGLGGYVEKVIVDVGNGPQECTQFTPFKQAMAISTRVGNFKWTGEQQRAVDDAIAVVALAKERFTADDVWAQLGPSFPVTKGLAARLNVAVRRKIIYNTGTVAHAKRGGLHDHAQRLTVWARYRGEHGV